MILVHLKVSHSYAKMNDQILAELDVEKVKESLAFQMHLMTSALLDSP